MKKALSILCFFVNCVADSPDMPFFPLDSGSVTVYKIFTYRANSSADNAPLRDSLVRKYDNYRVIDSVSFVRSMQDNNAPTQSDSCSISEYYIFCKQDGYVNSNANYEIGGEVKVAYYSVGSDSFFLYKYNHTSPSLSVRTRIDLYQRGIGRVYSYESYTSPGLNGALQSSDESVLISHRGKAVDGKFIYNSIIQLSTSVRLQKRLSRKISVKTNEYKRFHMLNGVNDIFGRFIR